jgi:hypothetical protein
VALVLVAMSLTACGAAPSKIVVSTVCPALPEYSKELQLKAAEELEAMPPGSVVAEVFMPDYGRMRDGVRACRSGQEQQQRKE